MAEQFRQGRGRGNRGGAAAGSGAAGPGAPIDLSSLSLRQASFQGFTAEDREKAELPEPPGENSVSDVLLRPGLLAEAEIIVAKIPDTLYLPQQAIFERDGKNVVYVRVEDRFEPRAVKLGGRTESQVAVLEGLRDGDTVALIDVEEARTPSKKGKDTKTKPQSKPSLPGSQAGLAPTPKAGDRS
jgi:hypothetical protein